MFVQVIQAKATDPLAVRKMWERWDDELKPGAKGYLGGTGGIADDGTFIDAARFESEEAARANSERPEQGEWWQEAERYLESPVFYDCKDVDIYMGGGSDDAGFVQVIQGNAKNIEEFRKMGESMNEADMAKQRPDVMGGFVAFGPDNGFSHFIYFTSEAEAREGESRDSSGDNEGPDWSQMVTDLKFIDLKEPWFSAP